MHTKMPTNPNERESHNIKGIPSDSIFFLQVVREKTINELCGKNFDSLTAKVDTLFEIINSVVEQKYGKNTKKLELLSFKNKSGYKLTISTMKLGEQKPYIKFEKDDNLIGKFNKDKTWSFEKNPIIDATNQEPQSEENHNIKITETKNDIIVESNENLGFIDEWDKLIKDILKFLRGKFTKCNVTVG